MVSAAVSCPYCGAENTASLPDQTDVKEVTQSYRTGLRGKQNLVELTCSCGSHFGVTYE